MIMYNAGSTNNRPLSSRATHSCNTGYTLTGGTFPSGGTRRVCVTGRMWNGSPPTCQGEFHCIHLNSCLTFLDTANTVPTEPPTTCPDLTVPANGMISYNMGTTSLRPVNTVATYTCVTGYTLTGGTFTTGTTRVCVSGGMWFGSPPTCQGEFCNSCTVCFCEYTQVKPIMNLCESNFWL